MRALFPELPLYVVSDFPPEGAENRDLKWIPYRVNRSFGENLSRCRAAFEGMSIRLAGVMLVPNVPFRRMRIVALTLAPAGFIAFNENLDNFMLRPRSVPAIVKHFVWRVTNFGRWIGKTVPATNWDRVFSYGAAWTAGMLRVRWLRQPRIRETHLNTDPQRWPVLARAFDQVPDLFCATAPSQEPLAGSDLNYVLHGNAECVLYDPVKLSVLGGSDDPRELSYRAWQRGWPTVEVAGAPLVSPHIFTSLDDARFLSRAVANPTVFRRLWKQALPKLSIKELRTAARFALRGCPSASPAFPEAEFLALTNGSVKVFPGRRNPAKPRVLIASCYMIFPLSHGGAVRMYNLMRRAASDFDQVLVAFSDELVIPPNEVLDICAEIVLVRREGSHSLPSTGNPQVVEEFASDSFRAALRQTIRKWRPDVAQLEFTQMAQYADVCAPARTILVEHDVTFDLYQQMLHLDNDWELCRQLNLWKRFETGAWNNVDRVVTMSEKDRRLVGNRAVTLPNGVDLDRFRPSAAEPEPRRILFIGSFAHLPNLMALEFFLKQVWPRLAQTTLHIIAGSRHEYFLNFYRDRVTVDLAQSGLEVEGFVSDVRPAYARAAVVIAPLVASAGTNIKVLEAMAMGRAVVTTSAGINGLDLSSGKDIVLANTAEDMAGEIERLFANPAARHHIETAARQTVERDFSWDIIATRLAALYSEITRSRES